MEHVIKKTRALKAKLLKLNDSEEISNSEIRENLLERKEWEKKRDDIVIIMEKTQEDTIGTEVETRPIKDLVDNLASKDIMDWLMRLKFQSTVFAI